MPEAQRDVLVGVAALLVRQLDVQSNRRRAATKRAFVGRLHDARSAAADHCESGVGQAAGEIDRLLVQRRVARGARAAKDRHGGPHFRQAFGGLHKLRDNSPQLPRFTRFLRRGALGHGDRAQAGNGFLTIDHDDSPMKRLLLVDGSSYLYRAFHAMPDLRTARGEPTGAIRGFGNMMRVLLAQYPSQFVACVFDARGKTFRDDLYPDYKSNRAAMPDDLAAQIAPIHELTAALGWPILEIERIEADGVIGILARHAEKHGVPTVISTGDKDLAQLVDPHCTLVNTMTRDGGAPEVLDEAGVVAKFGVRPDQIVDYLTLVGDSVDNVPGVPKVGAKTAAKWLQQYGSLAEIIAHADEIGGVVGANLRASLAWLPTAKRLVTVLTDGETTTQVPDFEALRARAPDLDRLRELYERHEFKTLLRDFPALSASTKSAAIVGATSPMTEQPGAERETAVSSEAAASNAAVALELHYETVLTEPQLDQWLAEIKIARLTRRANRMN